MPKRRIRKSIVREILAPRLEARHVDDLRSSGLLVDDILRSGCRTLTRKEATQALGFDPKCGGLSFRHIDVFGKVRTRVKPDRRPNSSGAKYLTPRGGRNSLFIPPTLRTQILQDPMEDIIVTEGEKKALKSVSAGFAAVSISGVWCWKTKETGASKPIPDLGGVNWEGRQVIIAFDSDAAINESVLAAEYELAMELQGRGANVRIVRIPEGRGEEKVGLDDFLASEGESAFVRLAKEARFPKAHKTTQTDRLFRLARRKCICIQDDLGVCYSRTEVGGHVETHRVGSRGFRAILAGILASAEDGVIASHVLKAVVDGLENHALVHGRILTAHNRIAQIRRGEVWYDLVDSDWRAVRIDAAGWNVVNNPTILFARYKHQVSQVEPIVGGSLTSVFNYIPVNDPDAQLLLLVYLVSCFLPDIPHPVLILHGSHGSGKSFAFCVLRQLVDPSDMQTLSFPSREELPQVLHHHWCPYFDNLPTLRDWQSDALCRAVTGEGFSKRMLYSDQDDVIFKFRRCIGLNGISVAATRPDLLDRSIIVRLERIDPSQRQTEDTLWSQFDRDRAKILGAIFDILSEAIRLYPTLNLHTTERMADFTQWGCAIAQAMGRKQSDFRKVYSANLRAQNEEVVSSHPVAATLRIFALKEGQWKGTASALYTELEPIAVKEKFDTKSREWPKGASALSRRIEEVRPNLIEVGISVTKTASREWEIQVI